MLIIQEKNKYKHFELRPNRYFSIKSRERIVEHFYCLIECVKVSWQSKDSGIVLR